jgi:hypothetical protein
VTWLGVVEVIGLLVVLLVLALLTLALRRRWLARQGGTFECSVRLRSSTPSAGWTLGVGRYNGDTLQWFRFFSYSLSPKVIFPRVESRVVSSREPNAVEAVALYAGQRVVTVVTRDGEGEEHEWELAMSPDSLTGLLSWLESAPPGSTHA